MILCEKETNKTEQPDFTDLSMFLTILDNGHVRYGRGILSFKKRVKLKGRMSLLLLSCECLYWI